MINGYFNAFTKSFDIAISKENKSASEATAFEKFINYLVLSSDDPTAFIGNASLLDDITVGGGYDLWLDGIAIRINGKIITSETDIQEILKVNKKVGIDFIFVQTKMKSKFEIADLTTLLKGVECFFTDENFKINDDIKNYQQLKNYCHSVNVSKQWDRHPNVYIYYATTGQKPNDEIFDNIIESGKKGLRDKELYFNEIEVQMIGGKDLINISRELENNYSIDLEAKDIIPLIVEGNENVKKSYIFTCSAKEFLKILTKEDGNLRRSLFNDNVRDYLGNRGAVNSEIEDTIKKNPEMFLLCNNGVTIVSSDFVQIKDKQIRIINPQIVNGCQTSNSIFNLREENNIEKVQLSVRVICTDDLNISNEIVRGTNKQNQVLDEAFECTRPFHKELEKYFSFRNDKQKIFYERRNKQYSTDATINKIQIANLRTITQSYVATFLRCPHKAHCHESNLLRQYAVDPRIIYNDSDKYSKYYLATYIWHTFEYIFRNNVENIKKYKTYKAFFYYIYIMSFGEYPPTKGNAIDGYCEKIIKDLDSDMFQKRIPEYIEIFKSAIEEWVNKGKSSYGIKDNKDFTNLLNDFISKKYFKGKELRPIEDNPPHIGKLLSFKMLENNKWFAFIKRGGNQSNIYFNEKAYKGEVRKLIPGVTLTYSLLDKKKDRASKVSLTNR